MTTASADKFPDRRTRRRTLSLCGSAHFLHDGLTDGVYVMLPLWAEAFGLNLTQVGLLKTVLSAALAGFQLPAGFLAERIGAARVLMLGTVIGGLGYLLAGTAGGFIGLIGALAITGIGASVQHPLSSAIVARAYREGGRRAALGIYNFTGDLGKMMVPTSIAFGAGVIGWRTSSMLYGVITMVGGIAIWLLLSRIGAAAAPAEIRSDVPANGTKGWGIHEPRGFWLLTATSILDTGTRYAFLPFLPFLLIEKGAAVENVGFALALVFTGGAVGKFACGLLAERIGIIRTVVITEAATGCGILALLVLPLSWSLALLPFIGIALNGTSSVLYGTVAEFVDENRQARAFGLFYTMGLSSGTVTPLVFGAIGDAAGVSTALAIVAFLAFAVIAICPFLGPRIAPTGSATPSS